MASYSVSVGDVPAAVADRVVQWGADGSVKGFDVGAGVDEGVGDVEVVAARGPVQRRFAFRAGVWGRRRPRRAAGRSPDRWGSSRAWSMRSGEVVLCVDYGRTGTTGVLVDRNGGWITLSLDTDRDVLSGAATLRRVAQRAETRPGGPPGQARRWCRRGGGRGGSRVCAALPVAWRGTGCPPCRCRRAGVCGRTAAGAGAAHAGDAVRSVKVGGRGVPAVSRRCSRSARPRMRRSVHPADG
jgi:hypothetical protein